MSVVVIGLNHRTAPLELLERVTRRRRRAVPKALDDLRLAAERQRGRRALDLQPHRGLRRRRAVPRRLRRHPRLLLRAAPALAPDELAAPPLQPVRRRGGHRTCSRWPPGSTRPCSARPRSSARSATRGSWRSARARARAALNLLFRHALEVGKRARTETAIGRGTASVSPRRGRDGRPSGSASLSRRKVLVVGAGDMGEGIGRRAGRRRRGRAGRGQPHRPSGPSRWPPGSAAGPWRSRELADGARRRRRRCSPPPAPAARADRPRR